MRSLFKFATLTTVVCIAVALSNGRATADPSFGVDPGGPGGLAPGAVLEPAPGAPAAGPLALPSVVLAPVALGMPAGADVDDISFGDDVFPFPGPFHAIFSVSTGATGHPASLAVSVLYPTVRLEGPAGGAGDFAVQGDLYSTFNTAGAAPPLGAYVAALPVPCGPIPMTNIQAADENGLPPFALGAPNVGLGLVDAAPGPPPGAIDDLDQLELLDSTVVDGGPTPPGVLDAPVFFTVSPATAALLPVLPGAPGPNTGGDVLAFVPGVGLVKWASFAMLGLVPGDDIDALEVSYSSGAPIPAGWVPGPDVIFFSLAPGSPSNPGLGSVCFAPGSGLPDDLYLDVTPFGPPPIPVIDAEMMGLNTLRSPGGTAVDNLDAVDFCLASFADVDGDLIDDGCDLDNDGDLVGDSIDNCPNIPNAAQINSDSGPMPPAGRTGSIDNGPGIAAVDDTVPNGDADGDACDTDFDNDLRPNVMDTNPVVGPICPAGVGMTDGHPSPAGGDNTNDDNGDGNPAPPMGTDAADNGPSWDTDNDGARDGVECIFGTNPRSAASRPTVAMCGGNADPDLDGLTTAAEQCKWGTNPNVADSDGDGIGDCVEANDTNGDNIQNFTSDVINSARAALFLIGRNMDFDLDGNNLVNYTGDTILSARMVFNFYANCP